MTDSDPERLPSEHDKEALEFVLSSLERGSDLDWQSFRDNHGGDAPGVAGIAEAAERYKQLLRDIRSARGESFLTAGERLGDFEVIELLACGGMGVVYRAKQHSLGGRVVALKVLHAIQRSEVGQDRFQREALVLSGLHHPNLAEVYGFGKSGPFLFIAMRLIPGDSLFHRVQRSKGPVDPSQAVGWCSDVAKALALVHSAGLVHRDVKPSNVVLESKNQGRELAVLVDFGLARPVEGLSRTTHGIAPLTAAYAAPEQLLGTPVDGRADIFSLGALLHDLLSGTPPDKRQRAASGLPPLPQSKAINRDLRAIVLKATQTAADRRYADCSELLQDLEAWGHGLPVQARRQSHGERARLLLRRFGPKALQWAAVGGCAALLLALITWGLRLSQHADEARAAAQVHDWPVLRKAYANIPSMLSRLFIPEASVHAVARRVSGLEGPDPLQRMADALERDDMTGALRLASSRIAEVGIGGDRPATRLLLDRARQAPDARARERAFVLLVLAISKAFMHNTSEPEASGEVIEFALAQMEKAQATHQREERMPMYAITILGALGGAEEARYLSQYWCGVRPGSEAMRLGAEALARMLRRSPSRGEQASMVADVPWNLVMERIKAMRREGLRGDWGFRISLLRLTTAFHLAARREGIPTDVAIAIPREWLNTDAIRWKGLGNFSTLVELAAANDPRCEQYSMLVSPPPRVDQPAELLGIVPGLLADPGLLRKHIDSLVRSGWTRSAAVALLQPHYDRTLKEVLDGSSALDQAHARPPSPASDSTGPPRTFPVQRVGAPEQGAAAAAWIIHPYDPPVLYGVATQLAIQNVRLLKEGISASVFLLADPGRSEVLLTFDPPAHDVLGWNLILSGQNSSRSSLPYQGISRIDLYLDGLWIETKSLSHVEIQADTFQIPSTWLSPGSHQLRLLLNHDSTTSYRLFSVSLRRRSP